MNVLDVLIERGYVEQMTHEDEIRDLLGGESITFYIGFDPTADSLHVGHYIQFMAMTYMQKAGHRPIFLAGGGTGMVGDPSGRTDMRKMLTVEEIDANCRSFGKQAERFIRFDEGRGLLINNADWLRDLNYLSFLREVGPHFSINRMLAAECYKSRLEEGLSFLELNYMVMQSYDFLHLYRNYDCKLQLGGNDQWSNIIGGVELVRRVDGGQVYGMTFTLLTNSQGQKMGKTASGALWLNKDKMPVYDFYQYWRNVDDADVEKCLALLTFLPMDEVKRLGQLPGAEINHAKEVLAFEVTKNVHGQEAAEEAQKAARALFAGSAQAGALPLSKMDPQAFEGEGYGLLSLLKDVGLVDSTSQARNLMKQGGVSLNDIAITDARYFVTLADFNQDKQVILRRGKKNYHIVELT